MYMIDERNKEMSTYVFYPMTTEVAAAICQWRYPEPYSLYNMDAGSECIEELMSGMYFYALDQESNLAGYICAGHAARVPGGYAIGLYDDNACLDIGLGLDPVRTGKGYGLQYLNQALCFFSTHYHANEFRLVVATFNDRAIRVYERTGFKKGPCFISKVDDQELEFMAMTYSLESYISGWVNPKIWGS